MVNVALYDDKYWAVAYSNGVRDEFFRRQSDWQSGRRGERSNLLLYINFPSGIRNQSPTERDQYTRGRAALHYTCVHVHRRPPSQKQNLVGASPGAPEPRCTRPRYVNSVPKSDTCRNKTSKISTTSGFVDCIIQLLIFRIIVIIIII